MNFAESDTISRNYFNSQVLLLIFCPTLMALVEALSGRDAAANVGLSRTLTNIPQRNMIRDAFAVSIRNMWIMYIVLGGLGFVCSLFIRRSKLSKDHVEIATGLRSEKPVENGGTELI